MVTFTHKNKYRIRNNLDSRKEMIATIGVMFERADIYASCFTCTWMEDKSGEAGGQLFWCRKWKQFPPLKVIVNGCESYDDNDEIPF
jgi:hypothetical protein